MKRRAKKLGMRGLYILGLGSQYAHLDVSTREILFCRIVPRPDDD